MGEFTCKNCGKKISVPDSHTEIRGTCPNCKAQLDTTGARSVYNLTLLDVPQLQDNQEDTELVGNAPEETDTTNKRELPWIIDFLLYPFSKAGLTIMGMMVSLSLLTWFIIWSLSLAAGQSLLLLVAIVPVIIGGIVGTFLLSLYMFWYLCECIRDSAYGGTRAPETMSYSPGLGEILWNAFRLLICIIILLVPMAICYRYSSPAGNLYIALFCFAIFFFPMALLAVVMFDSLAGLNPVLLIGSVISTFLPYTAMVLILVLVHLAIIEARANLTSSILVSILEYVLRLYLLIVAAHVLGWFYHRYQERLNWDV